MPTITRDQVKVPADVMPEARETYIDNYMKATRGTGRLMLFACDQKIEHLNKDFYGEGIDISDAEPEHLFEIGSQGTIGVLAGQRGLVAQYAPDYPEINYLIKMNSKTNLVKGCLLYTSQNGSNDGGQNQACHNKAADAFDGFKQEMIELGEVHGFLSRICSLRERVSRLRVLGE